MTLFQTLSQSLSPSWGLPGRLTMLMLLACLFTACEPERTDRDPGRSQAGSGEPGVDRSAKAIPASDVDFSRIQTILTSSCMPCHNRQTLPEVIERTEKADFASLDGETRVRILAELDELKTYMAEGMPISFTGQAELHKFFDSTPGEFYMMLEKGIMPPPWAPELMQRIDWPKYKPLAREERLELLKYSKPYTEKYLR